MIVEDWEPCYSRWSELSYCDASTPDRVEDTCRIACHNCNGDSLSIYLFDFFYQILRFYDV